MTETETPEADSEVFSCSFCGKSQKDVKKLIAGPAEVFICDECVDLCAEIIEETEGARKPSEDELASAWSAMLRSKSAAARAAEDGLAKIVGQARAKGLDWPQIAKSLGISAEEAEARYGS